VLRAAAITYVAGVASSAGYLVYLFLITGRSLLGRPRPPLPPQLRFQVGRTPFFDHIYNVGRVNRGSGDWS
jgi:hypothetical protein